MSAGRIDTHQHIVPAAYADWLASKGITAGGLPIPGWSAEGALQVMEENRVATAILSVSTPGVHLGDDAEARAKAREVNELTAEVVRQHPHRFGFFASLLLPDVDGSIAEAAYAFDALKADGVVLHCAVEGIYLGDPSWDALMEELNRRHAVIFAHPSELWGSQAKEIPPYAADFLLDTTRAALNMAKPGFFERFPHLKIILSHGGGFVPYAAERLARICSEDGSYSSGVNRLGRFYFDCALATSRYALPSLLAFVDASHVTFGTDWPYAPRDRSAHFTKLFDEFPLDETQRHAIDRGNAEKLFPRLA
jgi:predicted TIM-barrel fold metal-dependent hydrolase